MPHKGQSAIIATRHLLFCSFSDQMPQFFISFDEVDQIGV
jgi:hypothetical protein